MTRHEQSQDKRPERVVVVDADNPLHEIRCPAQFICCASDQAGATPARLPDAQYQNTSAGMLPGTSFSPP